MRTNRLGGREWEAKREEFSKGTENGLAKVCGKERTVKALHYVGM